MNKSTTQKQTDAEAQASQETAERRGLVENEAVAPAAPPAPVAVPPDPPAESPQGKPLPEWEAKT